MVRVKHVLAGVFVLGALSYGAWMVYVNKNPKPVPLISASEEPYKRVVNEDDIPANTMTHSTVHAVMGGSAAHDPSMDDLAPIPQESEPASTAPDIQSGYTMPKTETVP